MNCDTINQRLTTTLIKGMGESVNLSLGPGVNSPLDPFLFSFFFLFFLPPFVAPLVDDGALSILLYSLFLGPALSPALQRTRASSADGFRSDLSDMSLQCDQSGLLLR